MSSHGEAGRGADVMVRAAIGPLMREPRISAEQTSQLLRGNVARILAVEGDWLHVEGDDAYRGWLHRGYTVPFAETSGAVGVSLGGVVQDGARRVQLPPGARVLQSDTVLRGEWVAYAERERRFPWRADALADTANAFFASTPYEWGGVSPWGADCSGFVQAVLRLHGMQLPRDAREQATFGNEGSSDPASCAPGELLFFSEREDGGITHVGLAAGEGTMLHVALGRGGFAEENFGVSARSDAYTHALRTRFRFSRLLFG